MAGTFEPSQNDCNWANLQTKLPPCSWEAVRRVLVVSRRWKGDGRVSVGACLHLCLFAFVGTHSKTQRRTSPSHQSWNATG